MYKCVAVEEVQSFVERCMKAVGTDPQHCTALSQVLTEAEIRGHDTHGLNRLGKSCVNFKISQFCRRNNQYLRKGKPIAFRYRSISFTQNEERSF